MLMSHVPPQSDGFPLPRDAARRVRAGSAVAPLIAVRAGGYFARPGAARAAAELLRRPRGLSWPEIVVLVVLVGRADGRELDEAIRSGRLRPLVGWRPVLTSGRVARWLVASLVAGEAANVARACCEYAMCVRVPGDCDTGVPHVVGLLFFACLIAPAAALLWIASSLAAAHRVRAAARSALRCRPLGAPGGLDPSDRS
jgi:hypothetical protein